MFYKADFEPKAEFHFSLVTPIFGEVTSSGRYLHFTCNAPEQGR
jgi:hypothetical protein